MIQRKVKNYCVVIVMNRFSVHEVRTIEFGMCLNCRWHDCKYIWHESGLTLTCDNCGFVTFFPYVEEFKPTFAFIRHLIDSVDELDL